MSSFNGLSNGRVKCPTELSEKGYALRAAFPDFPEVAKGWQDKTAALIARLNPERDISYGDEALQNLDFYRVEKPNAPLLVFVHGGYWQSGDKSDVGLIAEPYVAAGINVAVINYSLAPQARIEDMVVEVRRCIKWLHANAARFGFDAGRISIMGHSAGGHLVSEMVANVPENQGMPDIKYCFAISGVFDLPPLVPSSVNKALSLDQARAEALSPAAKKAPVSARVHTIIGEHETGQFHLQSAAIAQQWGAAVTDHHVVPDTHHFTVLDVLADPSSPYSRVIADTINA
ncbi:alpha/beta hydrolase [Pusillimonas minor]|uniref:Alpha/beta hydrolase n=1 Tax=Pusillimonas minor TaxID=2697024 RepID=A0A842HQF8_9BURK|nr:alpha/beta hydrolase [Pusillimonas minor]MBC2770446.1 alpha/beta hydrolase [Pusillimonas minor]